MKYGKLLSSALCLALIGCGGRGGERGQRTVIQNKGSDTLVNVAQAWAESYQQVTSNTAVAVTGGGSGTGFASLLNGTVDIANASRSIKDNEAERLRAKGIEPIEYVVGYDALAVFLHPSNPATGFTIAQLASIYGEGGTAEKWTDLGINVPGCKNQEIVRVSRQNNSGTYEYFREAVLNKSDFRLGSRDMHGSKDVVDLVENTPCAIGYSGLAYTNEHVKMPCVDDGSGCVTPSETTALDGTYPISRPLFMYTAGRPTGEVKTYIDWILSDEGQCIIQEKGYAPVRSVKCGAAAAS